MARVDLPRHGANARSWRARFDVRLTRQSVDVTLRIKLVAGPGVSQPQIRRLQSTWEPAVEEIWSNRFALVMDGTARPIRIDLQFAALDEHYTVVVKNALPASADQLHWSRFSDARVIAHEVGHMLGAYDDYRGGGQRPENPQVDRLCVYACFRNNFFEAPSCPHGILEVLIIN